VCFIDGVLVLFYGKSYLLPYDDDDDVGIFLCCRDDDMQSIASLITPDTSYDVGNMDDIDNDDYDNDDADNDQGIGGVADSDSNLTISELTSQIEGAFSNDSSAHGTLLRHSGTSLLTAAVILRNT